MELRQLRCYPRLTSLSQLQLYLLIITAVFSAARSHTLVTVKLNKYTNEDNSKAQDDQLCNPDATPCDMEFEFKLLKPISFTFETPPVNEDNIIFTDTITIQDGSTIPNPFPGTEVEQTVTKGISELLLLLDVWHRRTNGDRVMMARLMYKRTFDTWGSVTITRTDEHSSINLTTSIECAPEYYRKPLTPDNMDEEVSNCFHCAETDKYTCNQEDGSKECKPGWTGAECDTEASPESCPSVQEANSTIVPSTYKTDSLEVGYTLTFSCQGPYLSYLSTSPLMTCLDTGNWNSTVPSCIPIVENIDKKIDRLRNIGLFVLAGVLVTFSSAVLIMNYIASYFISSEFHSPSSGISSEHKSQFVEEVGFEPDYTDKPHLAGQSGPGQEASSQQIRVNLKLNSQLGVEDVDF